MIDLTKPITVSTTLGMIDGPVLVVNEVREIRERAFANGSLGDPDLLGEAGEANEAYRRLFEAAPKMLAAIKKHLWFVERDLIAEIEGTTGETQETFAIRKGAELMFDGRVFHAECVEPETDEEGHATGAYRVHLEEMKGGRSTNHVYIASVQP
jgi:hypothetical protein